MQGKVSYPCLVVEPDIPSSKELNPALSRCKALLLKYLRLRTETISWPEGHPEQHPPYRANASLIVNLSQLVVFIRDIGRNCGETGIKNQICSLRSRNDSPVVRGVDELSVRGDRLKVKLGHVRHLEFTSEEFSMSGRGDIWEQIGR